MESSAVPGQISLVEFSMVLFQDTFWILGMYLAKGGMDQVLVYDPVRNRTAGTRRTLM